MNRIPLPQAVTASRVVAVMRKLPLARAVDTMRVLSESGIEAFEVTVESSDALPTIERAVQLGLTVGAGTVLTSAQAADAVAAGASFVVSPALVEDVVDWCVGHDVAVAPGAFSPTEVLSAWRRGVSVVKLFPASTGGPAHLQAVLAPFGDVLVMPTGGITDANAAAYLDAGAVAVGVGGWLTGSPDMAIAAARAQSLVTAVR